MPADQRAEEMRQSHHRTLRSLHGDIRAALATADKYLVRALVQANDNQGITEYTPDSLPSEADWAQLLYLIRQARNHIKLVVVDYIDEALDWGALGADGEAGAKHAAAFFFGEGTAGKPAKSANVVQLEPTGGRS
ncbi:MAG: hypothetical protein FWD17_15710 [Polyangiaceae bacterium]|nr:hypothetical protein [Polyangiaceae bacterium]